MASVKNQSAPGNNHSQASTRVGPSSKVVEQKTVTQWVQQTNDETKSEGQRGSVKATG